MENIDSDSRNEKCEVSAESEQEIKKFCQNIVSDSIHEDEDSVDVGDAAI